MLTDQYEKTVYILGCATSLAELDVALRLVTLLVCAATLTVNCIRLSRRQ